MTPPEFVDSFLETVLTFVSTISGQLLSWPVAVVLLGAIFRKPVADLIGRIESAEAPGVKITSRIIQRAKDAAVESAIEATEDAEDAEGADATEDTDASEPAEDVEPNRTTETAADAAAGEKAKSLKPDRPGERSDQVSGSTKPRVPKANQPVGRPTDEPPKGKTSKGVPRDGRTGRYLQSATPARRSNPWTPFERDALKGVTDSGGFKFDLDSPELSPDAIILQAYARLERSLDSLWALARPEEARDFPARLKAKSLWKLGILNNSWIESFADLSKVRNGVVHGFVKTTREEAREFELAATQLLLILVEQLRLLVQRGGYKTEGRDEPRPGEQAEQP